MRRAGEGVLLGLHELQVPLQKESEETKDAVHPSCFHSSSTPEYHNRSIVLTTSPERRQIGA